MALFRVETDFSGPINLIGGVKRRAQRLPREMRRETTEKIAVVAQFGARQTVTRRMQRAIAVKIGPGASPPRLGSTMVQPPRPMRVTPTMTKLASKGIARHVLRGVPHPTEKILGEGVVRQAAAGGIPRWPVSRDWGQLRSRRPTLGGRGWPSAQYVERR